MSKKRPLKINIADLPPRNKFIIKTIIRTYCKELNIYNQAHKKGIGLEATEEGVEKAIDSGELIIRYRDKIKGWRKFDGLNEEIIQKIENEEVSLSINPWPYYM